MSNKPTATFKYPSYAEVGFRAELVFVKNHPMLGDQNYVSTSNVLEIEHDEMGSIVRIETLNTTYLKESTEAAACSCSGCGCG